MPVIIRTVARATIPTNNKCTTRKRYTSEKNMESNKLFVYPIRTKKSIRTHNVQSDCQFDLPTEYCQFAVSILAFTDFDGRFVVCRFSPNFHVRTNILPFGLNVRLFRARTNPRVIATTMVHTTRSSSSSSSSKIVCVCVCLCARIPLRNGINRNTRRQTPDTDTVCLYIECVYSIFICAL